MSLPAIRVENIGKRYRLGTRERYRALRDTLTDMLKAPLRMFGGRSGTKEGDDDGAMLWALRNVTFDVQPGEVVGIIGRNGAGKSTLLKILSRITEPTEGRAEINGRVGSLLEVGTGFHPELSGRENVFLNGAILGMRREEITRKFDEIIAFAEVEKFVDTPVKRYSSGMYVRLAFAVAAHLEPEIMLVDEVLAVGDAAFQKKCLGKMGDVAREGRTVLFVSHNMAAVENLCERGVLLNHGGVEFVGTQTEAIGRYLKGLTDVSVTLRDRRDRRGRGGVRIVAIELRDAGGRPIDVAMCGQEIDIVMRYEAEPGISGRGVVASIAVKTAMDVPVFLHHNRLTKEEFGALPPRGAFVLRVKDLPLPPAGYRLDYSVIENGSLLDAIAEAMDLNVIAGDFYGSGEVPPISHGVSLVSGTWRLETE
ncbi:MAG TPA: ABC transporter ATP-binding protein [Candidatus Kapabacteria bacterium]|nr:ABC transporter ATP-binding protein [Candidatus Kapabacteria bacterium]